jgi:hypothetical protein
LDRLQNFPAEPEVTLERAKGIEPSYAAWEAAVLPLNYARKAQRPYLCSFLPRCRAVTA